MEKSHPVITLPIVFFWSVGLVVLIGFGWILHEEKDRQRFDVINGIAGCMLLFVTVLMMQVIFTAFSRAPKGTHGPILAIWFIVLLAWIIVSIGLQFGVDLDARPGWLFSGYMVALILAIFMKIFISSAALSGPSSSSGLAGAAGGVAVGIGAAGGVAGLDAVKNWFAEKTNQINTRSTFKNLVAARDPEKAIAYAYYVLLKHPEIAEQITGMGLESKFKKLAIDLKDIFDPQDRLDPKRRAAIEDDDVKWTYRRGDMVERFKQSNLLPILQGSTRTQVINHILDIPTSLFYNDRYGNVRQEVIVADLRSKLENLPATPQLRGNLQTLNRYQSYAEYMDVEEITTGRGGGGGGDGDEELVSFEDLKLIIERNEDLTLLDVYAFELARVSKVLDYKTSEFSKSNWEKLKDIEFQRSSKPNLAALLSAGNPQAGIFTAAQQILSQLGDSKCRAIADVIARCYTNSPSTFDKLNLFMELLKTNIRGCDDLTTFNDDDNVQAWYKYTKGEVEMPRPAVRRVEEEEEEGPRGRRDVPTFTIDLSEEEEEGEEESGARAGAGHDDPQARATARGGQRRRKKRGS
jgi:hypothetical protein